LPAHLIAANNPENPCHLGLNLDGISGFGFSALGPIGVTRFCWQLETSAIHLNDVIDEVAYRLIDA